MPTVPAGWSGFSSASLPRVAGAHRRGRPAATDPWSPAFPISAFPQLGEHFPCNWGFDDRGIVLRKLVAVITFLAILVLPAAAMAQPRWHRGAKSQVTV